MTKTPASELDALRGLLAAGKISQATFDVAARNVTAELDGDGTIAHGASAFAVGAGSVGVQGDNHGVINLGILIQEARPGATPQVLRRAYLARILRQADQLPLFAGDSASAQIRLSAVYTALLTLSEDDTGPGGRGRADGGANRLSALDMLNAAPRLVLLGGPGSGKSTFVNVVALSLAGELLGLPGPSLATLTAPLPGEEQRDEPPRPQRWDHGPMLPVHVVLRDLASRLPPANHPVDAQTILAFIRSGLEQAALEDFMPSMLQELHRGALILLDGLDEVPDAHERRQQIKQAVQQFAATFGNCRYVVTSRTYAYQRQDWKLDGFAQVQLLPFTQAQIDGFVDAWYAHMVQLLKLPEEAARDRAEALKQEIGRNERIRDLAERPLLLTLMAQLQTQGGGTLPQRREELYDKAVDLLLNTWEGMKVRVRPDGTKDFEPSLTEWLNADRDDIRKQLNRLAFEAHRDQPQMTGTADIAQHQLVTALLRASSRSADVQVKRLEQYLRDRAGILAAHGEGMYQFPHRSFQEYLAACHLTDDEFPDQLAALALADTNRWREVALLAGAKAARGSSLSAWALSETLCPAPSQPAANTADHWGALLAGGVLVESANLREVARRDLPKLERIRDWQLTILRGARLPAVERALAGRTLAALGDPRPDVTSLDGMQFCLVPPGPFMMGSDDVDYEKPEHTLELPYAYLISRFPVTVAQWREHLTASGPDTANNPAASGRANDPVTSVSWHDAMDFCDALTERWKGRLPPGFVVSLPSEPEWEKAARGGEQIPEAPAWVGLPDLALAFASAGRSKTNPSPRREYPWGDEFDAEKANAELIVGETSAVGTFPAGSGPYGSEDMAGNVWEWTRSLWGDDLFRPAFTYPYRFDDRAREDRRANNEVYRVVRGGSWYGRRGGARCAYRGWGGPGGRDGDLGFRVVLRSAPVS
jgi:formylglycine-generating enzyme required for sulfatase activity